MSGPAERKNGGNEGKTKHRSPSYPAHSLEKCLVWAQRFWDADKRAPTNIAVAVKHCGYSSVSGPAKVALSTMKKFGVLGEEGAERVKLSHAAIRYLMAPPVERAAI